MISDLNLLFDLKDVSKYKMLVNLPNDSTIQVKFVEKCFLTPTVVLKRVLYVPDFKFNLLYVSRLIAKNNCAIKFLSTFCAVQDFFTD